ncbi:hypothetical protein [Poritiphilus flavus]|uniref:Uncharacterized protein n=1 Tax=Poritiphilus flavus TaxID=2697053 RepID=A0A6L9EER2_9FLAO|nr:hypothetical protein [Poritiphilus flavus]NAS13072.1 hypothetical protein [Poritiphilus flavus]
MGDVIWGILGWGMVAFGSGIGIYMTIKFRNDSRGKTEKIISLNEKINSVGLINEELNRRIENIACDIEDIATSTNRISKKTRKLTESNLALSKTIKNFTKGSNQPFLIYFDQFSSPNELSIYTRIDGDAPTYITNIVVSEFYYTSKEIFNQNLRGPAIHENDHVQNFYPRQILPNIYQQLGTIKNLKGKKWRRFYIEIQTNNAKYYQHSFVLFYENIGISQWEHESKLYDQSRNKIIMSHKSPFITRETITKMEGEEYWHIHGGWFQDNYLPKEEVQDHFEIPEEQLKLETTALEKLTQSELIALANEQIQTLDSKIEAYRKKKKKISNRYRPLKDKIMADTSDMGKLNREMRNIMDKESEELNKEIEELILDYHKNLRIKLVTIRDFFF